MRRSIAVAMLLSPLASGCLDAPDQVVGVVSPNAFDSRQLRLRNMSRGYVVCRVTAPGLEPLVTPTLPPGATISFEILSDWGTLCPESIRLEIAAYDRANPDTSPLEDFSVLGQPYAAVSVEMLPSRDYGCRADPGWLTLDSRIDCTVLEADPQAAAIGVQAGWLPAQRLAGVHIDDPPAPASPQLFPLRGRVVNRLAQPIPYVEIRLPQYGLSVFADLQGRFGIALPAGDYLLEPVIPDVEISPPVHIFSHQLPEEVPIEFIALTDTVPDPPGAGE
ncbi:MAG: hypothetical protein HY718_08115 [Planctomycetes bacterium]|nr:hypothetical protein [Planctomycetota bacterium]